MSKDLNNAVPRLKPPYEINPNHRCDTLLLLTANENH